MTSYDTFLFQMVAGPLFLGWYQNVRPCLGQTASEKELLSTQDKGTRVIPHVEERSAEGGAGLL